MRFIYLQNKNKLLLTISLVAISIAINLGAENHLKKVFHSLFYSTVTISADNLEPCINSASTITFTGADGVAPYTFTYSINNGASQSITTAAGNSSIDLQLTNTQSGTFVYRITNIEDSNGVSDAVNEEITITVNSPPTVDFNFDNDSACSGTAIDFTPNINGNEPYNYNWNFGDGNTSTDKNPSHVFEALGCGDTTFDVELTITDANGCKASATKTINVQEKPDISFSDANFGGFSNCSNASSSNPEYTITVNNSSADNCVIGFSIDWGDGSTTANASFPITHTYNNIGVFNMAITGNGTNGCSNTVTYEIKNVNTPAGGFSSPGNTQNLCTPTAALDFGITNWGLNSSDTNYTVNFGDGTVETYTQTQLESSTFYNAADPENSATFPTPHSYSDGSCSNSNGQYIATLTVQNACASAEFTISNITVLEPSTPSFQSPPNACINLPVTFINTSTIGDNPGCNEAANFIWDFGDGTIVTHNNTSVTENQIHTYTNAGTYTVSLTIESFCSTEVFTQQICIEPQTTSEFTLDTNEGCIPFNVKTTNTTDESMLCATPTYFWSVSYADANCGNSSNFSYTNGTDENSKNPEFIFNEAGIYTLTLETTTTCGTVTTNRVVTVKKPPITAIEPIADACGSVTISPVGLVENCTQNAAGLSYNWTFVGGTPATANTLNPGNISYANPGIYTVTLEVTSECGVSNTATQTFEVLEQPTITNADLTQEICSNQFTNQINLSADNPAATFSLTATATAGISGFTTSGNTTQIPAQQLINSGSNPGTVTYTVTPSLNGCDGDSVDFVITVNPSPIFTTQPQSSEVCINGAATTLEVAYSNGVGAPSYQWFSNTINSNTGGTPIAGATNATFDADTSSEGTTYYYAEISFSSGGCSQIVSDVASVMVASQIVPDAVSPKEIICVGGSSSELEITFTGGTTNGTVSYQWYSNLVNSNVGGTPIAGATNSNYTPPTFTSVGNFYYYVEISNSSNGCNTATSDVYEVEVLTDPVIDTQPLASQELCQTTPAQSLTVSVSGGTASAYVYQWFLNTNNNNTGGTAIAGATNSTYTPSTNTVGTFYYYCVVSQSESGCSVVSNTSTLIVNAAPNFTTQPQSSEVCINGAATTLEVAYANGVGIPSYQWFSNTTNSNTGGTPIAGATNATYNADTSVAGTTYYYAEISFSSGGCSQIVSDVASVIVNQIPTISNASLTIYSGETFTFNPATVAGNIVPTNTQYTWGNPTINPASSITGASAVTVPTNAISQTLDNTTTSPATVLYTISPATANCPGSDFTLEVTVNPTLTPNTTITNITCFNANDGALETNITGGIPFAGANPYLISWTGPNGFTSSDADIFNLEAGTYNLTIEDRDGFTFSDSYQVIQPDVLQIITDNQQNVSCFNGNDAAINITIVGGTAPFTFNWSTANGSGISVNDEDQSGLTDGTYNLSITDRNNCSTSTSFIITEPTSMNIATVSKQDILCFDAATGSIDINVSGGTPLEISPGVFEYQYSWTGPNGFTSNQEDINAVTAGIYTVRATDNLNCFAESSIEIMQPDDINIAVTKTDVSCNGANDGSINIALSGGTRSYQISWSNFANGTSQNNLAAGTYVVTVTDDNSCTKQATIVIDEPLFSINPTISNISCNGANDGSITLNLVGGIVPINVAWTDDATAGVQRNNLSAGTYTVRVTDSDANQCPIEQTFTITEPPTIFVSETITDATDCAMINSGSIDIEVSGGSGSFTFNWNNGETTEDISNVPPGNYTVQITDGNNCTETKSYTITRPDELNISLTTNIIANCNTREVSQENIASVTGGFPPYTFSWSGGSVSGANDEVMTTSQNGSYIFTATDSRGCSVSETIPISLNQIGETSFRYRSFALDTYDLLSVDDPIQFTNESTGDFISTKWDFGDGSPIVTDENPIHTYDEVGNFTVRLTVEYEPNCVIIFERTLNITLGYTLIMPNAFTPNDDGYNDFIRPSYKGMKEVEMNIFDIWGTLVYSEKGTTLKGWDGSIRNKPAENGNYVMIIRGFTFYDKEITRNTPITLLR